MKIYAFSGLGADERVFNFLKIDYDLVPIKWIKPIKNENIIDYTKRLIKTYEIGKEEEFGILGVSFGGLIATEASKLLNPKFTILISSVETYKEVSNIYRFIGVSGIMNIIPKQILKPPKIFAYYLFGCKQKKLLEKIIDDTCVSFTKWALKELITWNNKEKVKNLIKIGGEKDKLLPPRGRNNHIIKNGEHFMIVDMGVKLSELINLEINNVL